MTLALIDWLIIGSFLATVIVIGLIVSRKGSRDAAAFFVGGRSMPWWLLGVSMVACTFSCDTPNLVTGMVRGGGVAANWGWWAFLITGMVTVFIYAQLWRRSKVMTDLEFYELRYSGKSAAFIRGFRSLYLGIFFNCLIMGTVTLAAIKIGQVIFDIPPWAAVVLGSVGVVVYATAGGIQSCIWADFFQYSVAMFGAVYAAVVACQQPQVGGLSGLLSNPNVLGRLSWMPDFTTWLAWVPLLLMPVAVQWWSVWYPGAEPGGGGYIAQRMLSAKDEKNAIGATLFFNFMHYAMRPWPWIIVALASLVVYPSLDSIKADFPGIDPSYLREDIAYPVMISKLGPGLLGLVVASLIAAYMSTIGTHLNWGSSYVVNDWYKRFMRPQAGQKELVLAGRVCTVVLMLIAAFFALTFLEDANQAFEILLLSGAGTGGIYLLRWFWWRINAWTEIAAMVAATIAAIWIVLGTGDEGTLKWYVDWAAVRDYVCVIDDAAVVDSVTAQQKQLLAQTEEVRKELDQRIAAWRRARRSDASARTAARTEYEAALDRLHRIQQAASIPLLVQAAADESLQPKLQQFYHQQKLWELQREKKRLSRTGDGAPRSIEDITISFGGVVKNGKIYLFHPLLNNLKFSVQLLVCVGLVTIVWLITTCITKPADPHTLRRFYKLCHPGGPGWRKVVQDAKADGEEIDSKNAVGDWKLPMQLVCVFLGCVAIYASLFAVGSFIYGHRIWGFALSAAALAAVVLLFKSFSKIGVESES
ncbi:MAG: Na+:solute symporter [Phycisphaerae bacterium]|nr:Na+:solute symporter [Phycisphaerae bacterium]